MSNKVYDILKFVAQVLLPAAGTLYLGLSKIWGFPYGEEVVGTITAVDLFLGAVLGISSVKYYNDGKDTMGTVSVDPVKETAEFDFGNVSLKDLMNMKQVKVNVETYDAKH